MNWGDLSGNLLGIIRPTVRDRFGRCPGCQALPPAVCHRTANQNRRPATGAQQQQRQRGWKLYSFHAPEVECIGKGKASAPYEFGVKASIATTNARAVRAARQNAAGQPLCATRWAS